MADNKALEVVQEFYDCLSSDEEVSALPNIFVKDDLYMFAEYGASINERDALSKAWQYLRSHKVIFQFSRLEPKDTVTKASKAYVFLNPESGDVITSGTLSVMLYRPMGKNNVFKQVLFPLTRQTGFGQRRYAIELSLVTVNGVLLDPGGQAAKSTNLYEELGFPCDVDSGP